MSPVVALFGRRARARAMSVRRGKADMGLGRPEVPN
jgi:hypothetical protein